MSDAEDSKGKGPDISSKQRRRKKGSTKKSSSSTTSLFPSSIVCTDRDLKRSKKSTECAVLLGLAIVFLYLFGLYELMESMPEITLRLRHYSMGSNMNLARMEMDSGIYKSEEEGDQEGGYLENIEEIDLKEIPTSQKKDSDLPIPEGTWPVSVRDDEYETMIHPGDMKTIMKVPTFWSPPLHNNKQYTREQAMQIGTCAEPDSVTGSFVRGEDCPLDQRTIFIGIASYRDFQCRQTLESIFLRAKNPKRVRVGVVDQISVGEDAACDDPIKPCEEDPEQVRAHSSMLATNRET